MGVRLSAGLVLMLAASLQAAQAASELRIVGTGDGMDLLKALGAAFTADHPDAAILVPPSIGSGGGIAAVGSGREVLARVARPLSDGERAQGLVYTPLVRLPSAFFINPSVTGISNLTPEQLVDIYAGRISNWSAIGGPDLRIEVVRREEQDSTLLVLRQTMGGWRDLEITERSKMATTTQDAIESVRAVPGAIGFGPFTSTLESGLTVLSIGGRHPRDFEYPSSAVLALVHRDGGVTADAQSFLGFARTSKAQSLLTVMGGLPVGR
jgi:phosphate transport system substrate-binding protein